MNWYLIQVKPNAHVMASKNLTNQGLEVFLPMIVKTSKKRGKFFNRPAPLFPGYLFIGVKKDILSWSKINATRGVARAISLDGSYKPVNIKVIDGLKNRCDSNNFLRPELNVKKGDSVMIEKGPFTKFICEVDQILDTKRVWVLLEIMQQKTKFKVALNDLSKVNSI